MKSASPPRPFAAAAALPPKTQAKGNAEAAAESFARTGVPNVTVTLVLQASEAPAPDSSNAVVMVVATVALSTMLEFCVTTTGTRTRLKAATSASASARRHTRTSAKRPKAVCVPAPVAALLPTIVGLRAALVALKPSGERSTGAPSTKSEKLAFCATSTRLYWRPAASNALELTKVPPDTKPAAPSAARTARKAKPAEADETSASVTPLVPRLLPSQAHTTATVTFAARAGGSVAYWPAKLMKSAPSGEGRRPRGSVSALPAPLASGTVVDSGAAPDVLPHFADK